MGKNYIDWLIHHWVSSLFVSLLPVRFQTILKWFRKRLFLLFFFDTRLWQSVTMLIGDKLSIKKELKSRDLLPSRSGVVREWVIICALAILKSQIDWFIDWLMNWLIDWLIDWLVEWFIFNWLIDWFISQLVEWLIDWLIGT